MGADNEKDRGKPYRSSRGNRSRRTRDADIDSTPPLRQGPRPRVRPRPRRPRSGRARSDPVRASGINESHPGPSIHGGDRKPRLISRTGIEQLVPAFAVGTEPLWDCSDMHLNLRQLRWILIIHERHLRPNPRCVSTRGSCSCVSNRLMSQSDTCLFPE